MNLVKYTNIPTQPDDGVFTLRTWFTQDETETETDAMHGHLFNQESILMIYIQKKYTVVLILS